jgi:hypothetical protein
MRLFLALLLSMAGGNLAATNLHAFITPHLAGHVRWMVFALVILGFCGVLVYLHRTRADRELKPILIAAVVVSGQWSIMELDDQLHHFIHLPYLTMVLAILSLLALWKGVKISHKHRHDLEEPRSLTRIPAVDHSPKIRALMALVPKESIQWEGEPFPVRMAGEDAWLTGDLESDIQALHKARPKFQQLLRGILPHCRTLEEVHLLWCDSEHKGGGDPEYVRRVSDLLQAYLPRAAFSTSRVEDLENFNELKGTLKSVYGGFARKKIPHENIAVDTTSGTKIYSITGALLTLNEKVVFQYVQTAGTAPDSEPEAFIYDLMWDKFPME